MFKYLEFNATGACVGSHIFTEGQETVPVGYMSCTDEQYENGADCSLVNGVIVLDSTRGLARVARDKRNAALVAADIEINRLEDNGQNATAWRVFRQALRDFPEQSGFPDLKLPRAPT